jgi:formylglycine-generating enzyme required for sulfatase activity
MELIRIPAGTFTMGSPVGELGRDSWESQHTVTLSQDFYLGKTEVTQQQWVAIRGGWPQDPPGPDAGVGNLHPAYNVSHDDVQAFLTDLDSVITEPGAFSLPTESQWEYAARGGTTTRFNFGSGVSAEEGCNPGGGREDNMWYCANNSGVSGDATWGSKAVGLKPANPWGLHDMHGNVWEWCSDWLDNYPGTVTDPTGPVSGTERVMRGGQWDREAQFCRSAQRGNSLPEDRLNYIGFRVLAVR